MAQFDDDVATSEVTENQFRSQISGRYNIGTVPNGGYVMSVALAAIQKKIPEREPLTTTMHYLRPTAVGDVDVIVEIVKRGKRYDTATARLVQNGKECARVLATFGSIANVPPNSPTAITGAPPSIVPVEDAIRMPIVDMFAIANEFDQRFEPATATFLEPNGVALLTGYIRFADGRNADPLSLPLFCDALPPPIFHVMQGAWFRPSSSPCTCEPNPQPVGCASNSKQGSCSGACSKKTASCGTKKISSSRSRGS